MVCRFRGVHALSLIEVKKKLLMAQKGGIDVNEVFNTSLWTGTGVARTITTGIDSGGGSLVWSKSRSFANPHVLVDTVRGAGNYLSTNTDAATISNAASVSSFTPSGYNLGTESIVNGNGTTQVGWQFRRAEKFFDIVQYTGDGTSGRSIAHSLGIKPGMVIVKRVDNTSPWVVQHIERGALYAILNQTDAFSEATTVWPSAANSTGFIIGTNAAVNSNGGTYIAYLFAHDPSPEGIIQCGSYVGNGSATGPVVNLGWRPQYLLIKNATAAVDWQVFDAVRGMSVGNDPRLIPNSSGAELTNVDALEAISSGFQIKTASGIVNTNAQTYIYMAIREAI